MKKELQLGALVEQKGRFCLPLDLVTRTLAIIGIRGSGKTTAAADIAEEFCEAACPGRRSTRQRGRARIFCLD